MDVQEQAEEEKGSRMITKTVRQVTFHHWLTQEKIALLFTFKCRQAEIRQIINMSES